MARFASHLVWKALYFQERIGTGRLKTSQLQLPHEHERTNEVFSFSDFSDFETYLFNLDSVRNKQSWHIENATMFEEGKHWASIVD